MGGGLFNDTGSTLTITDAQVTHNFAIGGFGGLGQGVGGGVYSLGVFVPDGAVIKKNHASTGNDESFPPKAIHGRVAGVEDPAGGPGCRSDPQVFRIVLIDQVLDVAGLLIGEEPARAEGASGALLGKSVESPVGVGRPPAANGLARDPKQVRDLGFGQA